MIQGGEQHFRLFALALGLSAFTVLASVAQDTIGFALGGLETAPRIWMLDVDAELSLPTWLSIVLLAAAALVLHDLWWRTRSAKGGWVWALLSVAFLALSFDEFASLHERVSTFLHSQFNTSGLLAFAWAAPAGLLSLVGLAAIWPALRRLPASVQAAMLASAALFLGGAVVMEIVGGTFAEKYSVFSAPYRICANLEEALEQGGVLLFIYTLLRYRSNL